MEKLVWKIEGEGGGGERNVSSVETIGRSCPKNY